MGARGGNCDGARGNESLMSRLRVRVRERLRVSERVTVRERLSVRGNESESNCVFF